MFGYISYKLIRENGEAIERYGCNTIVNAALDRMGKFIAEGNKGTGGISYLKLGTAKALFTEEAKQIDLLRPEFSVNLYKKAYLVEGGDGKLIDSNTATNKVSYRFMVNLYNPEYNIEVSEFGLFMKDNTMFSYVFLEESIEKRINDILFVDWVIIVHPPLGNKVNNQIIEYDEFWKMPKPFPIQLYSDYPSVNGFAVKWSAAQQVGVAGYNIYRKQYPNAWYDKIDTIETEIGDIIKVYQKPVTYTDTTLQWGKLYYYNMKVFNVSHKESDFLDDVEFPAIYLNAYPKDRKVELLWTHVLGLSNFDHYNIYRMITTNQREFIASTRSNVYTVQNLINGNGYSFIVVMVDSNAVEHYRSFEAYAVPTLHYPDAPILMSIVSGDESAILTWEEKDYTVSGYDVYTMSEIGGEFYYSFLSHLAGSGILSAGSYQFKAEIERLENDELYKFVLKSVDGEGDRSDFSNVVETTPTYTMLAMPKSFRGLGHDSMVELNWGPVEGARYYNVYMMDYLIMDWRLIDNTHDTFYNVGGLTNGTAYNFMVVAVDKKEREGIRTSPIVVVPFDKIPPAIPSNLSYVVESIGGGQSIIYLSWSANTEPDLNHYNVYGAGGSIGTLQKISEVGLPAHQRVASSGENYSFVVTAVDTSGNESGFSNEALVFIA